MDMLREVVGEVRMDPGIVYNDKGTTSGARPKAPGMRYKHYAPKGDLTIISGEEDIVVATINQMTKEALDKHYTIVSFMHFEGTDECKRKESQLDRNIQHSKGHSHRGNWQGRKQDDCPIHPRRHNQGLR
jgi:hypothetical protein